MFVRGIWSITMMVARPIIGKNLKKSYSRTIRHLTLKLDIKYLGIDILFTAMSNVVFNTFI